MQRFVSGMCHPVMRYIFLLSASIFFSCKKDQSCESCIPGTYEKNAKIVWTGPVEVDGCSWCLVIDNVSYHPANLAQNFQQDQLNVVVKYQLTSEHFICGLAGIGLPVINITKIRRQ
jgi:hypothetical protein